MLWLELQESLETLCILDGLYNEYQRVFPDVYQCPGLHVEMPGYVVSAIGSTVNKYFPLH